MSPNLADCSVLTATTAFLLRVTGGSENVLNRKNLLEGSKGRMSLLCYVSGR